MKVSRCAQICGRPFLQVVLINVEQAFGGYVSRLLRADIAAYRNERTNDWVGIDSNGRESVGYWAELGMCILTDEGKQN